MVTLKKNEAVKERLDQEINRVFPDRSNTGAENNYYEKIKKRQILIVEQIRDWDFEKNKEEIESIDRYLKTQINPKDMGKAELDMIRNFEEMCILIQKNNSVVAKDMTVMEFYSMLALIKKKKL